MILSHQLEFRVQTKDLVKLYFLLKWTMGSFIVDSKK